MVLSKNRLIYKILLQDDKTFRDTDLKIPSDVVPMQMDEKGKKGWGKVECAEGRVEGGTMEKEEGKKRIWP